MASLEFVEIKVKIPEKLHRFVKALLALYKKDEEEFWREELMGCLESLIESIEVPFQRGTDIREVNGLKEIFDC